MTDKEYKEYLNTRKTIVGGSRTGTITIGSFKYRTRSEIKRLKKGMTETHKSISV